MKSITGPRSSPAGTTKALPSSSRTDDPQPSPILTVIPLMRVALLVLLASGALGADTRPPAPEPGPFEVLTAARIDLEDPERDKTLRVFVSHPDGEGPFPLVLFSHGALGSGDVGFPLVEHWTSHGYVVLCPTHADSIKLRRESGERLDGTLDAIRGMGSWDENWTDRPLDLAFLLDALDQLEGKLPALAGKVDRERVAAAGHSLGAYTAQVAGGATVQVPGADEPQSLRDPRIDAVLQLSGQGVDQQGLHRESWADMKLPMMAVTGSRDFGAKRQDPSWRRDPFELSAPGDKYFVFIEGANHGSFTGKMAEREPGARLKHLTPEQRERIIARYQASRPDAGAAQKEIFGWVKQATTAFLDASLKDRAEAAAWLRSEALEQASQGRARVDHR